MRVRLLGTGSADGWPNPWCACVSCAAAAASGQLRGQTSALVDDRLLLDLGPDGPRAALRQGATLAAVTAVLVTHAHPDHHAVPAWMWRGWAPTRGPVTLLAPPAVLADARPRLDDTVTTVEARPGEEHELAGYRVRVLPAEHAGDAVLYDLTGPDGTRLLWGADTGPWDPAPCAGRAYDAVLLELTSDGRATHLDLESWPRQVAALRRAGAVTDRTRLVAVHLGHGNPPPAELAEVLAGWGATAPLDGTVLDLGAPAETAPRPSRTLVLGGARSGKSAYAERLVAAEPDVTYVATAPPREDDAEWGVRVQAHVARRPESWRTAETGDVAGVLASAEGAVLVDDLGLWLVRLLDAAGAWDDRQLADKALGEALPPLVEAVTRARRVVLVAPEVGSGVVPATTSGRAFRDLLGTTNAAVAAVCDEVVQVVAGLPRRLR
jgi:adenosylcobinamide kinase/adenosylcobinamide-phosphate guanylyltransferase